jgi:hypothetical protein
MPLMSSDDVIHKACKDALFVIPFSLKYDISQGLDACWPWKGYIALENYPELMYPTTSYKSRTILACRVQYIIHNGGIPEDYIVTHTCNCRTCMNPRHLLAMSKKEYKEYDYGRKMGVITQDNL